MNPTPPLSSPAAGTAGTTGSPRWLHAGFVWRGLRNARQLRPAMAGAAVLALAVLLVPMFTPFPMPLMLGLAAATLALILWWLQVDGLLQQNRPMLARLVPGHAQALRRSLWRQWALHTAVWAAVGLALTGSTQPSHVLGWVLGAALGLALLAWLVHEPWLWAVFGLLTGVGAALSRKLAPAVLEGWAGTGGWASLTGSALGVALVLLVAALAAAGLGRLIQSGSASHRRHTQRRDRLRALSRAMQNGGVPVRLQHGVFGGLHRLFDLPWRWLLRHTLAQTLTPGQPVPMGRLDLVLGCQAHWARQLGVALFLVLALVLPLTLLLLWVGSPTRTTHLADATRFGVCIAVFGLALNPVVLVGNSLRSHPREQGLLLLAPSVPRGPALNRAWSRHLLVQFLIGWGLATAVTLGPMLAFGSPGAQHYTAGFAAGCLPLVVYAWRDFARLRAGWGAQSHSVGALVAGSVAGGLAEMLELPMGTSLLAGAALTGVLVAGAVWRSRRHPPPWPAGRLG